MGFGMGFGIGMGLWQMGWDDGIWDGIWDGMGVGILPFPLIWVASIVVDDEYECKHFTQYRSKEFIDVRCIDHCVGFAKIDNRYFIIDKENAFDDADWENL